MYEHLKKMLSIAESIGTIESVELHGAGKYRPDGVEITGRTPDGKRYELELTLRPVEGDQNAEG